MHVVDVINNVTKQNHERHGVDAQCLTCETLQGEKKSANRNNVDTKMFLTF